MNALLPPFVIDVRVRERGERGFFLWVPLFLLWPFLLVAVLSALVVSVVLDLVLWLAGASFHHLTAMIFGALRVLAAVRGTHVRVDSDTTFVRVNIY
ncbi:MAG: hypothetical protein Q8K89_07660 [Actinomycetota bacterium]|nr:hypothetical protein [Actinomycetota bacterium]